MIKYLDNINEINSKMFQGFFEGWPDKPSAEKLLGKELMNRMMEILNKKYYMRTE